MSRLLWVLCIAVLACGCDDAIEVRVDLMRGDLEVEQVRVWTEPTDVSDDRLKTGPTLLPERVRVFADTERFSIKFPPTVDGQRVAVVVDFFNAGNLVGSATAETTVERGAQVTLTPGEIEWCGDGVVRAYVEECDSNTPDCEACRSIPFDAGSPSDGGRRDGGDDAGPFDAGDIDAGDVDAGDVDAGDVDAGDIDAGDIDAGDIDAGDVDGGNIDAGIIDAGHADAGAVDAGPVDAGPTFPSNGQSATFSFDNELTELLSGADAVLDPPGTDVEFVAGIQESAAGIEDDEGSALFALLNPLVGTNGDFTVLMWLRDDTPLVNGSILSLRGNNGQSRMLSSRNGSLVLSGKVLSVQLEVDAPIWSATSSGRFRHVALVAEDDVFQIVVDGELASGAMQPGGGIPGFPETIGFRNPLGTRRYFDLVEVYPRALSPAEIDDRRLGTTPAAPDDPVAAYLFENSLVDDTGGTEAVASAVRYALGPTERAFALAPDATLGVPAITTGNDTASASFWFRDDNTSPLATLVEVANGLTIKVEEANGTTRLVVERPGAAFAVMRLANYPDLIPRGHWHHALVTVDRDQTPSERVQVLVDGRVLPFERTVGFSNASVDAITSTPWTFGRFADGWQGAIDSVQLFDRALSQADAQALAVQGKPVFPAPPTRYWSFDDIPTEAVVGGPVTPNNPPVFEPGVSASALTFLQSDVLRAGDAVPIAGSTGFTIATYLRLNQTPTGPSTIAGFFDGDNGTDVRIGVGVDALFLDVAGDDAVDRYVQTNDPRANFNNGDWHLVVARFDGTVNELNRGSIFVDGVEMEISIGTVLPPSANSTVRPWRFSADALLEDQLNVTLDEFAFFDRALSDEEIAAFRLPE